MKPEWIASIALIESSGNVTAYRFEKHLNEASTGLTQVLHSTALWLAKDLNYTEYGIPEFEEDLYDPLKALYFCGAYLTWLSTYKGKKRSEEFVVRVSLSLLLSFLCLDWMRAVLTQLRQGYNGGPNGINLDVTMHYWKKYCKAKEEILRIVGNSAHTTSITDGRSSQSSASRSYTVKPGDTLWAISKANGCKVDELKKLNGLTTNDLQVGQRINLPGNTAASGGGGKKGCVII